MAEIKAPPLSRELIEYLDARFPERSPSPKDSNRKVWMDAGKVDLVRHIKSLFEKQHTAVIT